MSSGKVTNRDIGTNCTIAGIYDEKLYLNLMIYDVAFHDGQIKYYPADLIPEKC